VLLALEAMKTAQQHNFQSLATVGIENTHDAAVKVAVDWQDVSGGANMEFSWPKSGQPTGPLTPQPGKPVPPAAVSFMNWLDARPGPPPAGPKEHAWSYMAGWHAEHGCEDFYSNLWRDAAIVRELESRLRSSGAWQLAQAMAS
jgi:hypothetical protein